MIVTDEDVSNFLCILRCQRRVLGGMVLDGDVGVCTALDIHD